MTTPYGIVSNRAEYSYAGGWTAKMVYCLANADVAAFLAAHYLDKYPVASVGDMAVVGITDEPWMEGDMLSSTGKSTSRRVTLNFALVYLDVAWPTGITRPAYRTGTTLKLHTTCAGQYQQIPASAIAPTTGAGPGPNTYNSRFMAENEYQVEWDRVETAPNFSGYVGTVNSDTFMGCAAGQLLCTGASQVASFLLNPNQPYAYRTTVNLKQKALVIPSGTNAGTYGWNDWYNPQRKLWEAMNLSNNLPPYNPVAFANMFA